ncbi:polyketide cyclase [Nocardia panacis]|uniref:Polyketide cyclase n=2 Tax=Nocardia panacis TaxID=2340916 RepID=A0A3A4KGL4_9NOCA|nr:polyketide cyclase [Nocardia panacis]
MRMRKPPSEVFAALADPQRTTRFWFTKSTGPLEPGAAVSWTWEMYDITTNVQVTAFEQDRRIAFTWDNGPKPTNVEILFTEREDGSTFVSIEESGFDGDAEAVTEWRLGSLGGFTLMIAALKAFVEHGIVLSLVADRFPDVHPRY